MPKGITQLQPNEGRESRIVVLPENLRPYVCQLLDMWGIEHVFWGCLTIQAGKGPMDIQEAYDMLKVFDEIGIFALGPALLRSTVTQEEMLTLCQQLRASDWYINQEVEEFADAMHLPIDSEYVQDFADDLHGGMKYSKQAQEWILEGRRHMRNAR